MIKVIEDLRNNDEGTIISLDNPIFRKLIGFRCLITSIGLILLGVLFLIFSPFIMILSIIDIISDFIWNKCLGFIPSKIKLKLNKLKIKKDLDNYFGKIENLEPLVLKNFEFNDSSLKTFIFNFIISYKDQYYTCDKKGRITCGLNRRRSLEDIYRICKNYYHDCKPEEVLKILIDLLIEKRIYASYCTMINRYVYHVNSINWIKSNPTEYSSRYEFKTILNYYGKT